jgi:hypothetical protein
MSNKQHQKKLEKSKHQIFSSIVRYFTTLPSHYLSIRLLGAILLLLIVVLTGNLLTKNGFILIAAVVGYILWIAFVNWFKNHDES